MKRLFEKLRGSSAFILITVLVVLAAFLCSFSDDIGINPFASGYPLDNPVQAVISENGNVFVTDSSRKIAVTDSENRLLYVIYGDNYDSTFDLADSAAAENGTVYVIDSSYSYDGAYAYRQRLLKFTDNGRKREELYVVDTLNDEGKQVIYLDSPVVMDGDIYFSEITEDGICIKRADGEICSFMPLENAYDIVADSTFNEKFEITAALMNGDVLTCLDGEVMNIYHAREFDTKEYRSLITEIVYGNGYLYLNDMGLRRIYRLVDGEQETFVDRNEFSKVTPDAFAENALYSGLSFSNGILSVVSAHYKYDSESAQYGYTYDTAAKNEAGTVVFYTNSMGISLGYRLMVLAVYAALLLAVLLGAYSLYKAAEIVKAANLGKSYTQIIILVTAILVTIAVSYTIFDRCNQRYVMVSSENLANIAYLTDSTIDKDILASIDSPDDYYSEDYAYLSGQISDILKSSINGESNIYAVIYKVYNNVISEVYRNDFRHAVMYPMAANFVGSIEQGIAKSGECYISTDFQLAEGSYTFALIPSYDEAGELLGLIEIGTDYHNFAAENSALYRKILIISAMAVIIVMLLFGEIINAAAAVKEKRNAADKKLPYPPAVIRPVTFMVFFTVDITVTFLPIYGISLWNENFPIASEVAAALPLSAELFLAGMSSLLCGFIIKKPKSRWMCVAGASLFIAGNGLSAFAPNLWVLICANSLCGIGEGIVAVAINSFIAGYADEETQNKGFIHYNAAVLAGVNCGTVVGSLICDNAGVFGAYMAAVASAVLTVLLAAWLIENKETAAVQETAGTCSIREFITVDMVRYIACVYAPYLVCSAFLSYYFPIVAESHSLSAVEISMAFLISGVISIYAGSVIGEVVIDRFGTRKSMILASFIYASALCYLFVNPSILSCYVVIVMFAVANSFGPSAQSAYFISRPEVEKIGSNRALGIKSTVECVAEACGSLIFGAALMLGEQRGIFLIAAVFSALLAGFTVKHSKISSNR